jgi:hypothetical protein
MVGRPREQDDMDLGTWSKVRLQAALKAAGLSTNGSKEQLLERLQKATDNSEDGGREFEAGGPASGSASSAVMAADIVLIHDHTWEPLQNPETGILVLLQGSEVSRYSTSGSLLSTTTVL